MFTDIRAAVGRLWGATTTILISLGGALMAVKADPDLAPFVAQMTTSYPWSTKAIGAVCLGAAVLRMIAPPQSKVV